MHRKRLFFFAFRSVCTTFAGMNQINDYEIMAPVGSRDSLAAALKAGAA